MLNEAEKYKAEDEETKLRIESKNELENYLFMIKNFSEDKEATTKLSSDNMNTLTRVISEATEWQDKNQSATKAEFDEKKKEIENIVNPLIASMKDTESTTDQSPMSENMAKEFTSGTPDEGPKIEEID